MPDCLPAWDSFSPTSSPAAGFRSQVLPVLPVNHSRIMYLRGNPRWALGLGLGILPFWHLNTPWNKILWYDFFSFRSCTVCRKKRSLRSGSFFERFPKISLGELILLIYFWSMDVSRRKTARMLSMNNNLVCKIFRSLEDVCSLDIDNNPFVPFGGAAVIKCDESKFNHKAKVKRIMRPVCFSPWINTKAETFLFLLTDCKFSGFRKLTDPYILFH